LQDGREARRHQQHPRLTRRLLTEQRGKLLAIDFGVIAFHLRLELQIALDNHLAQIAQGRGQRRAVEALADGHRRTGKIRIGAEHMRDVVAPGLADVPAKSALLDGALRAGVIVNHQAMQHDLGIGFDEKYRLLHVHEQLRRVVSQDVKQIAVADAA
jgi:hypothetical protein